MKNLVALEPVLGAILCRAKFLACCCFCIRKRKFYGNVQRNISRFLFFEKNSKSLFFKALDLIISEKCMVTPVFFFIYNTPYPISTLWHSNNPRKNIFVLVGTVLNSTVV